MMIGYKVNNGQFMPKPSHSASWSDALAIGLHAENKTHPTKSKKTVPLSVLKVDGVDLQRFIFLKGVMQTHEHKFLQ